ncbi:MAG TPA: 4-(cytidine 5'-diphospho)-2-C-methyl-D-erythritol kinase [Pseudolabrys sp.]|nr:4-(cytidine 5'-diphospho)-2-C-methyl-D-erythritol kinase [Pseudolabrys sp.]
MHEPLIDKAPAKINLTLRVLGRREDGLHELESLVAFADLADTLELDLNAPLAIDVSGTFAETAGPQDNNLVLKAARALAERAPKLKTGRFTLRKQIPAAAGLGGGSADAAAALRLLARANDLALDDQDVRRAAGLVGADVPVCLDPKTRVMAGIGDVLYEPIKLTPLPALLANPRVAVSTRDVFAAFEPADRTRKYLLDPPSGFEPLVDFLAAYGNDLNRAAIACAPVIADVLVALRGLPGCRLARMSGSGATCFGLFETEGEAQTAARKLAGLREDWWVQAAVLAPNHLDET